MPDYDEVIEIVSTTESADAPWREHAYEDWEFYSGIQWSDDEIAKMNAKHKPYLTINTIKPQVKVLKGFQRNNQMDLRVFSEDDTPEADETAIALSKAIKSVQRDNYSDIIFSRKFGMGQICGRGYSGGYVDFSDDPFGKIKHFYIDPFDVGFDLTAQAPDLSDMDYIYRFVHLTEDELLDRYPQADVTSLKKAQGFNSEISPRQRFFASRTFESGDYEPNRHGPACDQWTQRLHELRKSFPFLEYWYRKREKVFFIADPESGAFQSMNSKKAAEALSAIVPGSFVVEHSVPRIHVQVLGNDGQVLEDAPAMQEGSIFPIFPYFPDTESLQYEGIVRSLKDPQRERNKRRSQLLHILSRLPQAGLFVEENAVKDWQKFNEGIREPGFTEVVQSIAGILPVKMDTIPSFFYTMEREAVEDMKEVSGVNPDLLGFKDKNPSGKAIALRQQQGLTIHGDAFDNLRLSWLLYGRWLVSSIRAFYTYEKYFNLIASDGTFERIVLNKRDDVTGAIMNNIQAASFNVFIDQSMNTPSTRLALFYDLIELLQYGVPIDPVTVIQMSPFEEKEKIIQNIMEAQKREAETHAAQIGQGVGPPAQGKRRS